MLPTGPITGPTGPQTFAKINPWPFKQGQYVSIYVTSGDQIIGQYMTHDDQHVLISNPLAYKSYTYSQPATDWGNSYYNNYYSGSRGSVDGMTPNFTNTNFLPGIVGNNTYQTYWNFWGRYAVGHNYGITPEFINPCAVFKSQIISIVVVDPEDLQNRQLIPGRY